MQIAFLLPSAGVIFLNLLMICLPKLKLNSFHRYVIPIEHQEKFENLVERCIGRSRAYDNYIRHKTVMVPPSVLQKNGIPFYRVIYYIFSHIKFSKIVVLSIYLSNLFIFLFNSVQFADRPKTRTVCHHTAESLSFRVQYGIQHGRSNEFRLLAMAKVL